MNRPDDEMDLTQLQKPVMFWHPDTRAAMKAWLHGVEVLQTNGNWIAVISAIWTPGLCYRAKPAPAPAPNLIDRKCGFFNLPSDIVMALSAAHALIATMSGGAPDLRKAYEEAIK